MVTICHQLSLRPHVLIAHNSQSIRRSLDVTSENNNSLISDTISLDVLNAVKSISDAFNMTSDDGGAVIGGSSGNGKRRRNKSHSAVNGEDLLYGYHHHHHIHYHRHH